MPSTPLRFEEKEKRLICQGEWDLPHLAQIQSLLDKLSLPKGEVTVDGAGITRMDSAGVWLLMDWQKRMEKRGTKLQWVNFTEQAQSLFKIVEEELGRYKQPKPIKQLNPLAKLGKQSVEQTQQFIAYLAFIGQLTFETMRIMGHVRQWRIPSLAAVIYKTGYQALPIIGLLSFLIGVTLAYQMGIQLKNYGANIYIVDLIGLSVLREFGPLLTAIMVAGRTGAAFTAQLGMMKLNQEIDALNTMGVTPTELLILPRMIGLIIALPLLSIWADIFGVLGGMVMSSNTLNVSMYDFLTRFPTVIPLKTLFLGLGKTPIFAFIIASVGCFQGMRVRNSAESVGINTTKSVVLSIFFIIVADSLFSILYSKLKL